MFRALKTQSVRETPSRRPQNTSCRVVDGKQERLHGHGQICAELTHGGKFYSASRCTEEGELMRKRAQTGVRAHAGLSIRDIKKG